jgi:hypothetical protein
VIGAYMNENINNLIEEENYTELYTSLKEVIDRIGFTNDNFALVIKAIGLFIQNFYLDEAQYLIDRLYFQTKQKQVKKTLLNMIEEAKVLLGYDQDKLDVYSNAISLGRKYYHNYDLYSAYDAYLWGYYATNNEIFLYYIGKMLYKIGNYEDAYYYLNEYIKRPASKASKAYLYLGKISRKNHRFVDAYQYVELLNTLSIITDANFHINNDYDPTNKDNDSTKFFMQRYLIKHKFDFEEKIDDYPELCYIEELLKNGNEVAALKEIKRLEKQQDKPKELKKSLNILKSNMTLYRNKSKN